MSVCAEHRGREERRVVRNSFVFLAGNEGLLCFFRDCGPVAERERIGYEEHEVLCFASFEN